MRTRNGASPGYWKLGCWRCRRPATPAGRITQAKRINQVKTAAWRRSPRRYPHWIAMVCLLMAFGGVPAKSEAQGLGQETRVVQGSVLNPQEHPQPNAIVYLENQKTLEVKSFITAKDGSYRFGELSTDADYQVWAKYQGMKSKDRSISSFDSKSQIHFDLQLEPSKRAAK